MRKTKLITGVIGSCKWGTQLSRSAWPTTHLSPPRRCSRLTVKMAWERDEAAFMAVEPTVRAEFPVSRQPTISWVVNTSFSVRPTICGTTAARHFQLDVLMINYWNTTNFTSELFLLFTYFDAFLRIFSDANHRFVLWRTQKIQNLFVVNLDGKKKPQTNLQ